MRLWSSTAQNSTLLPQRSERAPARKTAAPWRRFFILCRRGMRRTCLRTILFGAFAQPKLDNMYTIVCIPPEQNHPKISCSEVRAVRHSRTKSASSRSGMPDRNDTIPPRSNSSRRFPAAEACQYVNSPPRESAFRRVCDSAVCRSLIGRNNKRDFRAD